MKKKYSIILALLGLLFLAAPIASMFIDFGSGTDDAACDVIEDVTGSGQFINIDTLGLEPSEAAEPWLFVLQVVIGLSIFFIAIWQLKKLKNNKAK